jgi:hypothetical protein
VLVLSACNGTADDPSVWSIDPIEVFIQINNEFGDNLLETSAQGNWHESTFRCLFENTNYFCDKDTEIDPANIQNPEFFYGISIAGLILDPYTTIPVIGFGAFSGKRQMDDDIVFYWPDGSEDTIHIWNHFYYNDKGYPITQRKIYLNGEESSNWITLIKQPLASSEPEDE